MSDTEQAKTYCLVISCPDAVGIVAEVSKFVAEHDGSFVESNHYTDVQGAWFYMRNVINADSLSISIEEFREQFQAVADKFEMIWTVRASNEKQKVVLLASHASHCLADLLYRWHSNELNCDIPCVVSNHENLRSMVEWHGIPFHHVPVTKENKPEAFKQMNEIIERHNADTVVLARYMQIIPPELCQKFAGRLINIHHSFLPSFIGANPYQKAYERGVKLIGATSHYVTEDLDEGPIIEQDVIRVNHSCSKEDLVRMGKDVESAVLSRALRYHLDDRVIVRGNKCVVFQ
ncbi:formyltetrahydrofolate deformylase [Dasania sp. GY-MA-18]|uniref:Formyltetrahydrofolate deformylase n=1 Tax=Dasania phycosphaerae TaxID=2950436 RepID=A0A9J6RQU2_9GAMM|nr:MULTISPECIES: formyltetrahydrofolate deformylase [Dasania]MCR8924157.1 formyltetrahydrofolate deformylase [Dasania sp. GY-MA-18]MCZ0866730.1 formyltetrahydrofolate deformylase [Dasania phycosphaerae]MCZ0870315.1 formyltetrahydrofolate deformylase [Dasania phycosphaerae]